MSGATRLRNTRMRASFSKIRSEEHTSELQSHLNLVCRLLLEKKKKTIKIVANKTIVCRLLVEKKKKKEIKLSDQNPMGKRQGIVEERRTGACSNMEDSAADRP